MAEGVEVALGEKGLLNAGLHALGEDGAGAASGIEQLHDEDEVRCLAGAELGGEVGLDAVFLHAAEGRIGHDAVDAFFRAPVAEGEA
jgi:hypothetical protein